MDAGIMMVKGRAEESEVSSSTRRSAYGGVPDEIAERGLKLFAKEVRPVLKTWRTQTTAIAAE